MHGCQYYCLPVEMEELLLLPWQPEVVMWFYGRCRCLCPPRGQHTVIHVWRSRVETQADIHALTKCVYMKLKMGFKYTPSLPPVLGTFCMTSMVMLHHICHCSSAGGSVALLRVLELPLPKETWVCSLRWHLKTTGMLCN